MPQANATMDSVTDVEREIAQIVVYLRGELGYQTESLGSLRRQVQENEMMIRAMDQTLRGRGEDLGLVGWVTVLRRSWIALVALLGAAFGYLLNDVVDTLGGRVGAQQVVRSEDR